MCDKLQNDKKKLVQIVFSSIVNKDFLFQIVNS